MKPKAPRLILVALALLTALCAVPQTSHATTTTTLTIKANGSPVTSVASGTAVTLTAVVTGGGSGIKPGQVTFCDAAVAYCTDVHLLGTAQLTSAGTATLKFIPGIGVHSWKAIFPGTKIHTASSSTASSLTVPGKYPTTTTFTQSGSAGNYTLSAAVTGVGNKPGLTFPTGTVSFLDASAGNKILDTVKVVSGVAGLSWKMPAQSSIGSYPQFIAVGDFNGDGIPDIAATLTPNNNKPGFVVILLGNGDGTFTTGASVETGDAPDSIAVGDFNADGNTDLAVSCATSNTLTVLLGNGDGTFKHAAPTPVLGVDVWGVTVGDFNGDGNADLAVTTLEEVDVLLGNGDGTFTAARSVTTGLYPSSSVVGDFNGDGKLDLIAFSEESDSVVLLGNGDGTFTRGDTLPPLAGGLGQIAVGDFNRDGKLDLAMVHGGIGVPSESIVTILMGKGDGTFTATTTPSDGISPVAVVMTDFNGDGKQDLAVGNAEGSVTFLAGNGDGTFRLLSKQMPRHLSPNCEAIADFDGDGRPDLAAIGFDQGTITVFLTQMTQPATAAVDGIYLTGTSAHQVQASYSGDSGYHSSVSTTIPVPSPTATLSANQVWFGGQPGRVASPAKSVTLTNTGTQSLDISNIAIAGPGVQYFLTSNNCPASLAVNTACTFRFRIDPKNPNLTWATLSITDNAVGSPHQIFASGFGTGDAILSISSTRMEFGYQTVGTQTAAQTSTLTSTGNLDVSIDSITLSNSIPSSFVTSNNCGTYLPVNASCTIRARFTPKKPGGTQADIYIFDGFVNHNILLTGTGVEHPLSVTPVSLFFFPQNVGVLSGPATISVVNLGTTALTITSIALTGAPPTQYLTSNDCPNSLAANASCTVRVCFYPKVKGVLTADLNVSYDGANSPQVVPITGTGQ